MLQKIILILFIILEPKYPSTEPVLKTLEERCQKALYHVGCGLNCLQYFKNLNPQFTYEENMVCNKQSNILKTLLINVLNLERDGR